MNDYIFGYFGLFFMLFFRFCVCVCVCSREKNCKTLIWSDLIYLISPNFSTIQPVKLYESFRSSEKWHGIRFANRFAKFILCINLQDNFETFWETCDFRNFHEYSEILYQINSILFILLHALSEIKFLMLLSEMYGMSGILIYLHTFDYILNWLFCYGLLCIWIFWQISK